MRLNLWKTSGLLLLCGALAFLAGCEEDSSSGDSGTPSAAAGAGGSGAGASGAGQGGSDAKAPPDLAGRWKSACTAAPQPDGSTQHFTLDFLLDATTWGLDYVVHGDEVCSAPFLTVHIEGPYQLTGPSSGVEGAWEGTFSFTSKTVTPGMEAAVGFLSGLPGCGDGSFAVGTADDVFSGGCPGLGQYPKTSCEADFDLVKREGDVLQFGARPADNNMCSPDRRPTAMSPVKLQKQAAP